jgi:hypothetical protein
MRPARELLDNIGVSLAANATTREALIRALKLSTDSNVSDSKITLDSCLTVFSSEFTVFLGYNNTTLMDNLSDLFDLHDIWKYDTKTQGTDEIVRPFLNIIGATTPALLNSSMPRDTIGGGLASRIIFIFEEKKGKSISLFDQRVDKELWKILRDDLEVIGRISGQFIADQETKDVFTPWYKEQDKHPPIADPRFDAYHGRRAVHIIKLCMILSAARSDSRDVTSNDFDKALSLLMETEKKMPKVFESFGRMENTDIMMNVGAEIIARGEVTFRDLMKKFYYDADKATLEGMVATLTSMGWCVTVTEPGKGSVIRYTREVSNESGRGGQQ